MGLMDVAVTVGLTSIAFLMGFCVRGLFAEAAEQLPAVERRSGQYEPVQAKRTPLSRVARGQAEQP